MILHSGATLQADGSFRHATVKLTANQLAKKLIMEKLDTIEDWEDEYDHTDEMTEREKDLVREAVEKQRVRVAKFLGEY